MTLADDVTLDDLIMAKDDLSGADIKVSGLWKFGLLEGLRTLGVAGRLRVWIRVHSHHVALTFHPDGRFAFYLEPFSALIYEVNGPTHVNPQGSVINSTTSCARPG